MNSINLLLKSINLIINSILKSDPQHNSLILNLENNTLCFLFTDLDIKIHIKSFNNSVKIFQDHMYQSPNILTGTSGDILSMLLKKYPESLIKDQTIQYHGDLKVLEKYNDFFRNIKPDIPFYLQKQGYYKTSFFIEKVLFKNINIFNVKNHDYLHNIKDYLQEEKRLFPSKEEVQDFFDDIQQLKQFYDRLEMKYYQIIRQGCK